MEAKTIPTFLTSLVIAWFVLVSISLVLMPTFNALRWVGGVVEGGQATKLFLVSLGGWFRTFVYPIELSPLGLVDMGLPVTSTGVLYHFLPFIALIPAGLGLVFYGKPEGIMMGVPVLLFVFVSFFPTMNMFFGVDVSFPDVILKLVFSVALAVMTSVLSGGDAL